MTATTGAVDCVWFLLVEAATSYPARDRFYEGLGDWLDVGAVRGHCNQSLPVRHTRDPRPASMNCTRFRTAPRSARTLRDRAMVAAAAAAPSQEQVRNAGQ